ncbi:MAG: transcription elongation factor GreA [Oscillospiraceae bacterium]|jgi:transcription elongation factor GreA|nr:transcription elongation factor GreA [Oscillospiraceae bacterium]
MATKKTILTREGFKLLEQELEELKTKKRKEIAGKIKEALAFGDLSENSEYDEAKNEQVLIETRILEIESIIKNAELIDERHVRTDHVRVGCKIKILKVDSNLEYEYRIVGSNESDPTNGKISDSSPVGSALIGKRVNEIATAKTPSGVQNYKVIGISR